MDVTRLVRQGLECTGPASADSSSKMNERDAKPYSSSSKLQPVIRCLEVRAASRRGRTISASVLSHATCRCIVLDPVE